VIEIVERGIEVVHVFMPKEGIFPKFSGAMNIGYTATELVRVKFSKDFKHTSLHLDRMGLEGELHDQGDTKWMVITRPVREGVSKGEEDGRRSPALRAGHPPNGKAVLGVAHPQGV
jgi:hypothetical protein